MTQRAYGLASVLSLQCGLLVSACTTETSTLDIQAKFAYPNGDYSTLGHVSAESKHTGLSFSGPEMTREVFLDLQQQAMAQKPNADFVVNYVISSSVTQIPPIPISWTTFRLEGTALKVLEVGKQRLSEGGMPSQTRAQ